MGAPPNEPNAVMAMVLGILGVVVCGIIAPFAWSIGKKSLNNVRAHPGQFSGEGMAQAGYILGIIGTILLIVVGIFILFWLLFVVAVVGTGFAA